MEVISSHQSHIRSPIKDKSRHYNKFINKTILQLLNRLLMENSLFQKVKVDYAL